METIFGTDGIRTTVGTEPFTIQQLPRLGQAIALWTQKKYGRSPSILLAHDTRISSSFVKSALKTGLLLYPSQIFDASILTTPALFQILHHQTRFDCGIMISASHNPYQDNGIKLIDAEHGKLTSEDERIISELFYTQSEQFDYNVLGTESIWLKAEEDYITYIISCFDSQFLQGTKIILDCAHGAAYKIAPKIFETLGATVIQCNTLPNGININKQCGALYPEALQKTVVSHNADAGFAFDGDADRVIAVNRYGQIKNGDDILAILLQHPRYVQTPAIVGTIFTNYGLETFLKTNNKTLIRTPVGDKFVAEKLTENNLLLGGEPSGHIIARDYLNTGDGVFIALRVLETMQLSDNNDMHSFTKFPQVLINVPAYKKKDLDSSPIAEVIAASKAQLYDGRLVVRYSGTEPLLRIMVEDADYDHAQLIGTQLSKQLEKELT